MNLRFHDLRHTFGTRAVDNGGALSSVQKIMGHKTTVTTMQYVHATDEGKRRAVQAVETAAKKAGRRLVPQNEESAGEEVSSNPVNC